MTNAKKSDTNKQEWEVLSVTYRIGEKIFAATPASKEDIAKAGLKGGCKCGDEFCVGGWMLRCMAGGGGECTWYETNQPC